MSRAKSDLYANDFFLCPNFILIHLFDGNARDCYDTLSSTRSLLNVRKFSVELLSFN